MSHQYQGTREELVACVRKWGEVNTDGLLSHRCQFFSVPHLEGFIGFLLASRQAVVYGDPVAPEENKGVLAEAFHQYCKEQEIGVVYFMTSKSFTQWAKKQGSFGTIEFGVKFIFNPLVSAINKTGRPAIVLRNKIRKAASAGIKVEEYSGNDLELERSIENVATRWLQGRKGIQAYLACLNLFGDRYGKRWFYATENGNVIGVLLLNELEAHNGWLLNNVLVVPEAVSGVSELLVLHALQTLEQERCERVIVGPVPAKKLGEIVGYGTFMTGLLRWIFSCLKKILRVSRHEVFWKKFQPEVDSSYLLFEKSNFKLSALRALLKAFHC